MMRRLNALGIGCWFDLGLAAGDDWRKIVNEKLKSVSAGIIAFTPDVFDESSPWVFYEGEFLRERGVAIPTRFESCKLQPPFARDHARNLEPWFMVYGGSASLPLEARGWTTGASNSFEWQSVLSALEPLLKRTNLALLDEIFDRIGRACFGGDLELAMEQHFDLDLRTALQPNLEDLTRIQLLIADWLGDAPASDPCRTRVSALEQSVSSLIKVHSGASAQFWNDGVRKGLNAAASRIPGGEFRDLESSPTMRVIAPRAFRIGSPINEIGRSDHEGPQRQVQIARQFAIAVEPVTVAQWRGFADETGLVDPSGIVTWDNATRSWRFTRGASWRAPGIAQEDTHPVVGVTWHEARLYCAWLSDLTSQSYRLPSEVEWEFAARAGSEGPLPAGVDNIGAAGGASTAACASMARNAFGLAGMVGNIWEWCEDSWARGYGDLANDGVPRNRADEPMRVARGGGWRSPRQDVRCAARKGFKADEGSSHVGFRVARAIDQA